MQEEPAAMSNFLRNPEYPKYNAQSSQVRVMLGLSPKAKLPPEGMAPRVVQGILIWVEPYVPTLRADGRRYKSSYHRVMARCTSCDRTMSAGRLHQHVCKGRV